MSHELMLSEEEAISSELFDALIRRALAEAIREKQRLRNCSNLTAVMYHASMKSHLQTSEYRTRSE